MESMTNQPEQTVGSTPHHRAAEIFRDIFAAQSFGYAIQFRLIVLILPATLTLVMLRSPVNLQEMPVEGRFIHTCIVLIPLLFSLWLIWIAFRSAVTVNASGLNCRDFSLLNVQRNIRWEQITGATVDTIKPYQGTPERAARRGAGLVRYHPETVCRQERCGAGHPEAERRHFGNTGNRLRRIKKITVIFSGSLKRHDN